MLCKSWKGFFTDIMEKPNENTNNYEQENEQISHYNEDIDNEHGRGNIGVVDDDDDDDNSLSPLRVKKFLRDNPEFLEKHIMEEVDLEELERWMIRRMQRAKKLNQQSGGNNGGRNGRKTSLSRWKFCVHADKRQMLQDLTNSLQLKPTKVHVLWELANCISSAVNADGFNLYITENGNPDMLAVYLGQNSSGTPKLQKIKSGQAAIPSYVAHTREPIRFSKGDIDVRFPEGIPSKSDVGHVLCQAIVQPDGQLIAVLELLRRNDASAFHEEDEEISCSYLVWGGIALHYAHLFLNLNKQKKLNDFLLAVVKSIFQDMVSMDTLVLKIMNFAQRLVDADRASLFLVDSKSKELYATIFDIGIDDVKPNNQQQSSHNNINNYDPLNNIDNNFNNNNYYGIGKSGGSCDDNGSSSNDINNDKNISNGGIGDIENIEENNIQIPVDECYKKRDEIRFPIGTGIAGQVALTGEILNITDAYSDPRFNRLIDLKTGYKTETILCMPIFIRGSVIGVVQMVNKRSGYFNKEDEESFETFAVYCGLALHHAKLYDKIRRSEQKYRVTLEVLSYHNTSTEEEVQQFLENNTIPPEIIKNIDNYFFNPFDYNDFEKLKFTTFMFIDLFGLKRFDQNSLIRFTLTIKKNYRRVPYHNWSHGFSVANTMYTILKKSPDSFRPIESLALFIASLCHDLDHRGKNNKFMLDTESPLASIYSTSTMEHHHFNQTVTILQQEGHNIFAKLSSSEYKQVLGLIKHCILATDLALFFPYKTKLSTLVDEEKFSWSIMEHRLLIQAIAMTASDLSASAKPWDIQVQTVKTIFEEFYEQGDAERLAGLQPIPMMDRQQPEQQAISQVGFIKGICIPCYTLLYRLIPETKPLLDMCQKNLNRWQKIASEINEAVTTGTDIETNTVTALASSNPSSSSQLSLVAHSSIETTTTTMND